MMKENGKLVIGVELGGAVLKDFTLRAALVRDSVEIMETGDERAVNSDHYMGVCMFAKRLSFDGLDQEKVTPELIMDMCETDMEEVHKADGRLKVKEAAFRGKDEDDASADPGGGEAGDTAQRSDGHAGVGADGVAG